MNNPSKRDFKVGQTVRILNDLDDGELFVGKGSIGKIAKIVDESTKYYSMVMACVYVHYEKHWFSVEDLEVIE